MKYCRTLEGLLKALDKGERVGLKYVSKSRTSEGYIIYLVDGTNLIVWEDTYDRIKDHLVLVD